MEEILASIRRIIADEGASLDEKPEPKPAPPHAAAVAPARPAVAKMPPPPLQDDVLDLATFSTPPADDVTIMGANDLEFSVPKPQAAAAPVPKPAPIAAPPPPMPVMPAPVQAPVAIAAPAPVQAPPYQESAPQIALLSSPSNAAVSNAFGALNQSILAQNARTIDDMARELMRPMLKSWLDENLPSLVERLVRAEIERVARGR